MIAPAAFVEYLKNFAQRLIADFAHASRRQFKTVASANDIPLFFKCLLDAFQVFQMLVGLIAQ